MFRRLASLALLGSVCLWGSAEAYDRKDMGIDMTVNWPQEPWFWAMVQALAVVLTLVLIYLQMRIQTSAHIVQTLSAIHARWTERSMMTARLHVCQNYLDRRTDFDGISECIAEFIDELGAYVRIGAVPADSMWQAQSWYIEHYYCMFRDGMAEIRKQYHDDTLYENAEWLFHKMGKVSKRRRAPRPERGESDLQRFAADEVKTAKAFLGLRYADENRCEA